MAGVANAAAVVEWGSADRAAVQQALAVRGRRRRVVVAEEGWLSGWWLPSMNLGELPSDGTRNGKALSLSGSPGMPTHRLSECHQHQ